MVSLQKAFLPLCSCRLAIITAFCCDMFDSIIKLYFTGKYGLNCCFVVTSVEAWECNFLPSPPCPSTKLLVVLTLFLSPYLHILCHKFVSQRCHWVAGCCCTLAALHLFVTRGSRISANPFEHFF